MDDTFPSTQLYIADSSWIMGNCSIRRVLRMCGISRGHTSSLFWGTLLSTLVVPLLVLRVTFGMQVSRALLPQTLAVLLTTNRV